MSDTIFLEKLPNAYEPVPCEEASDPKYIKHVHCEGARFHVLWWDSNGTHCFESKCIINKR